MKFDVDTLVQHNTVQLTATTTVLLLIIQQEGLSGLRISLLDSIPSLLDVYLTVLQHSIDVARYRQERLFDVLAGPRRRLEEAESMKVGEVFAFFRRDSAFSVHVRLVTDDHIDGLLRLNVKPRLLQPLFQVLKAPAFCDVVDEQDTNWIAVVGFCDWSEQTKWLIERTAIDNALI